MAGLFTGTLVTEDFKNKASYSASQESVGEGFDSSAEKCEARGNLIASIVASIFKATSIDATTSTVVAVTE